MKKAWLLESFGVSLLLFGPFYFPLIFAGNITLYHHRLQFRNELSGILLDIVVFAALGTAMLFGLSRLPALPKKIAYAIFSGVGVWLFVDCVFSLLAIGIDTQKDDLTVGAIKIPYWYNFVVTWYLRREALLIIVPVFVLLLAFVTVESFGSIVKVVRVLIAATGFNAIWMFPQLLYIAFGVQPVGAFDHSSAQVNHAMKRRVIWVLFDELSYDLVFDHPQKERPLQKFQGLRSESVSFGNITPMGTSTDRIIPSLLAGRPVYRIRSSLNGGLWYKEGTGLDWIRFDANETVFRVARDNGLSSGVVGWFNPYCRLFASVLTSCYWEQGIQQEMPVEGLGASASKSVVQNALVIPVAMISQKSMRPQGAGDVTLRQNIEDYRSLMTQSEKMIRNPEIDFVFLHLPVPHPPGFFDSRTHQLCECGNYLDNLVLADDTLGVLMKDINETPWADETTLIASSDHSWRVPIWKGTPGWTPEEESVTADRVEPDMRPVFLVHFPHQNTGVDIKGPVPERVEHDIIASVLKGEIASPEALGSFVERADQSSALKQETPRQAVAGK
jgi:hypothetical protein